MTVQSLAAWLRCPVCQAPLDRTLQSLALACASGHTFDVNKRGYINLLPSNNKMIGDSPSMLDARRSFLSAGHFAPIRAALVASAADAIGAAFVDSPDKVSTLRIIDAGCGTGYYLEGFLADSHAPVEALAMDISPHAVARTVRSSRELQSVETTETLVDGLVADIWKPLPIRDACADILFTVFAPRNLDEFRRVLKPTGLLLVVVPTARHIHQIRSAGQALDIPAEKADRLEASSSALFTLRARTAVEYDVQLTALETLELVGMGPSSHHASVPEAAAHGGQTTTVTISVDVLTFVLR